MQQDNVTTKSEADRRAVFFEIPGEPRGKGRPRFNCRTGRAYTDDKTTAYEDLVIIQYLKAAKDFSFPENTGLSVHITAYFAIPESASIKKQNKMLFGAIQPCKRPDVDNIAKIICDALNGLAYKDDAQITYLSVLKSYSLEPRVEVFLKTGSLIETSAHAVSEL